MSKQLFVIFLIEHACEGFGSSHFLTSFLSDYSAAGKDRVRQCVLKCLRIFADLIQKYQNNGNNLHTLFGENSAIGIKLKELCRYMLNSYMLEAKTMKMDPFNVNGNASIESAGWLKRFQDTKEICIDVLLSLGHLKTAFQFSIEFLYFRGIMESYQATIDLEEIKLRETQVIDISHFNVTAKVNSSPSLLWNEIIKLARNSHNMFGTENVCLAEYIMTWLEVNHKPAQILKLSTVTPHEFLDFIEVFNPLNHLLLPNFTVSKSSNIVCYCLVICYCSCHY